MLSVTALCNNLKYEIKKRCAKFNCTPLIYIMYDEILITH